MRLYHMAKIGEFAHRVFRAVSTDRRYLAFLDQNSRMTDLLLVRHFCSCFLLFQEETDHDCTIFGSFRLSDDRGRGARGLGGKKTNEQLPDAAWQLTLSLDAPNLEPPVVQWAVLDKDPVSGFRERIKRMEGFYQTRLGQAKDETQKEMEHSVQMTVGWDTGFRDVTGDQLYLLSGAPGSCNGFTSNRPAGKKWIVTKIAAHQGKARLLVPARGRETGRTDQPNAYRGECVRSGAPLSTKRWG